MKSRFLALAPFVLFLVVFTALNIGYSSPTIVRDNFPLFAAFVAIIASFFTFQKNETINEKVEVFIQGATQNIIVHMCFIFYVSTVFTSMLEQTGGIQAAVNLCLACIPTWALLPGMFLVTSLFSFTVGTSMGAIAAFMPIATNIASQLYINPSLMAATIVCGAMFGDNLSVLSDTTIAAVKITNASMKEKLILNSKIAFPAFICAIALLLYQNHLYAPTLSDLTLPTLQLFDFIQLIPYALVFYLAFTSLDILATLIIGIVITIILGLTCESLTLLQAINLIFDGFYTSKAMVNVFILVLVLAGLAHIISYNGGITYMIESLEHKISSQRYAQGIIFLLVTLINMTIAINTIAILITGPVGTKISEKYNIDAAQTACILDIGSCVSQGILPYAPQLLLAASMAHVSAISLLPYLYYQYFLAAALMLMIAFKKIAIQ